MALLLWTPKKKDFPTVEPVAAPAPVPSKTHRPLPKSVVQWAKSEGLSDGDRLAANYEKALETMQRFHFRARIIQHLNDGDLLVELVDWKEKDFPRMQYYAVANYPSHGATIDRQIISICGSVVGSYTYNTIDGANRTIPEWDCVEP